MKHTTWESGKSHLLKGINTPALKKLQWLEQIRQTLSLLPKKTLEIHKKLRKQNENE